MRISNVTIQQQSITAILDRQAELHKTELKLASGKSYLTPSDDPAAAATTVGLDQTIRAHEQYQKNADRAESRLQLEDSVLESMSNALQRARELTVQANNGNMSPENRLHIAAEIDEIIDQVLELGNTTDGNGDYLFAGSKGNTVPFVDNGAGNFAYQGDQTRRELQIGPTRSVADADTGFKVFMDVDDGTGTGGTQDIFTTLYTLSADLKANNMPGNHLGDIDRGLDKVLEVRASLGARLRAVDDEVAKNDAVLVDMKTLKSELNDLDYAEAISEFNLQLTGLQAAQQSYTKVQNLSLFNYL